MGYYNRKQRREIAKKCFRANVKVDDIQVQAVHDMQVDTTKQVTQLLMHSMALVLMQDYKALQKKDTRLVNFVSLVHSKINYLKNNKTVTREEQNIIKATNAALNQWWNIKREKDKQNEEAK